MKYALAMITTDRSLNNRKNYIFDTLDNLRRAEVFISPLYHSMTIHIDGQQQKYAQELYNHVQDLPNITIKIYDESAGSAGNALRAHRDLQKTEEKWLMILEDDLNFSFKFLEKVNKWLKDAYDPKRYVYQIGVWNRYVDHYGQDNHGPWFDFYGHEEPGKKVYTKEKPTTLMRGSQCYIMKREHSIELSDYIESIMNGERLIHHDMRIRHWLNKKAIEENDNEVGFIRSPKPTTFVQHIGKESAVYTVKKYIDPEFYFSMR